MGPLEQVPEIVLGHSSVDIRVLLDVLEEPLVNGRVDERVQRLGGGRDKSEGGLESVVSDFKALLYFFNEKCGEEIFSVVGRVLCLMLLIERDWKGDVVTGFGDAAESGRDAVDSNFTKGD